MFYKYLEIEQLISKIKMNKKKQNYQQLSINQCKNKLSNSQNALQPKLIKQLLYSMILTMQKFQNKWQQLIKNSNNNTNEQLFELVKNKVIQIEQRRKLWDLGMADIYSQKFEIKKNLKARMQQMDQFEQDTKLEIQLMKQQICLKFKELQKQKNSIGLMVDEKIGKVESKVDNLVMNKIKQFEGEIQKIIKQLNENYKMIEKKNIQQFNNSFKFVITCEQMYNRLKQKSQVMQKAPVRGKLQNFSQKTKPQQNQKIRQPIYIDVSNSKTKINAEQIQKKYCQNIQIILHNINLLETYQKSLDQCNSTIQRFEAKLIVLGEKFQSIQNKLSDIFSDINPYRSSIKQRKEEAIRVQPNNILLNHQFLNVSSTFLNKFIIQRNKITYYNRQGADSTCILLGKQPTRVKNRFAIRVINTKQKYISIGIVDARYLQERDCWNKQNFIFLRGFKGQLYSGPINKIRETGCTFQAGDQINVIVNHRKNLIQWFVNDELRASLVDQKISNEGINWVPLIRLFTNWDQVQFLFQKKQ